MTLKIASVLRLQLTNNNGEWRFQKVTISSGVNLFGESEESTFKIDQKFNEKNFFYPLHQINALVAICLL